MSGCFESDLSIEIWFREMTLLGVDASRETEANSARIVRRAWYLIALCPTPIRRVLPSPHPESALEKLLEDGHTEIAARTVVGSHHDIVLHHSPIRGRTVAGILRDDRRVTESGGQSAALAIIGAWVRLLNSIPDAATARTALVVASGNRTTRKMMIDFKLRTLGT